MIAVNVTFNYDADFDRSRIVKVAGNARALFEGLPGLRLKFFTLNEDNRRATNFYLWDSEEAARDFFSDEMTARVTGLYGVAPTVEFLEISEFVDNTAA